MLHLLGRILLSGACLLVVLLAVAAPVQAGDPAADPIQEDLVRGYNAFGFRLLQQIAQADSGANVFISPASAAIALSMLYNGTAGTTREELAQLLGLGVGTQDEENAANSALLKSLQSTDSAVKLAVANSVWYRDTYQFRPDFLTRMRAVFGARVEGARFDDPSTVTAINEWVKANTQGKIDQIIEQFDPLDVMLLLNAVYFKGEWTYPFDTMHTSDTTFHLADGRTTRIPMMHQREHYRYLATESFQAVELPYGKRTYNMLILMPNEPDGLAQLAAEIDAPTWSEWQGRLVLQDIQLALPRFTLEYDRDFNDVLKALGVESVFDPQLADLSGLYEPSANSQYGNLYVSRVMQKTYLAVNEEGTEAAAVTGAVVTAASVPPPPIEVTIDRPFLCAIVDGQSGLILFLGSIFEPADAGTQGH